MYRKFYLTILLLICFVSIRLLPAFSQSTVAEMFANISPLAALALCGGMLLPMRIAMILTFGTFLLSDTILNLKYGFSVITPYSLFLLMFFAAIYFLGYSLRNKKSFSVLLVSTFLTSILFYFFANTFSFMFDSGYQKNLTGWLLANSKGLPGYPPAWLFGIKFILSNTLFASAFYFALMPRNETIDVAIPQTQKI